MHKIVKIVKQNQEYWKTISIAMIGKMRGGKTNTASHIAEYYSQQGWEIRYLQAPEPTEATKTIITPTQAKGVLVILDDLSYKFTNVNNPEVKEFLNTYSRVRHKIGTDNVIVIYIFHYLRSIPPFLRECTIRTLSGPVSNIEIKRLANEGFFNMSDMYDYMEELRNAFYNKIIDKRPTLVTDSFRTEIIWIPLSKYDITQHDYTWILHEGKEEKEETNSNGSNKLYISSIKGLWPEQATPYIIYLRSKINDKNIVIVKIKSEQPIQLVKQESHRQEPIIITVKERRRK